MGFSKLAEDNEEIMYDRLMMRDAYTFRSYHSYGQNKNKGEIAITPKHTISTSDKQNKERI